MKRNTFLMCSDFGVHSRTQNVRRVEPHAPLLLAGKSETMKTAFPFLSYCPFLNLSCENAAVSPGLTESAKSPVSPNVTRDPCQDAEICAPSQNIPYWFGESSGTGCPRSQSSTIRPRSKRKMWTTATPRSLGVRFTGE